MKGDILARLRSGEVLVCDGAMGTMLQSMGYRPGKPPELWGLENEDALRSIHRGYIEAGADVILTNTFGGNGIKLGRSGLEDRVEEINRELARVAVDEAARSGKAVYVAGDVGPTGEFMEPLGELSEGRAVEVFARQIEALVEGGVDLILIETMMDPREAAAAVKAARSVCRLPVFASMSYNVAPNGFRTMMGTSPQQAVEALLEAGADGVGANCGDVLASMMPDLIREMREAGAELIIVEPNAGKPRLIEGKTVFPQTPQEMARSVPAMIEAGANIIGGCCGTTPQHIRLIARAVREATGGERG